MMPMMVAGCLVGLSDRLVIDSTLELIRLAREENKPIVLDGVRLPMSLTSL